MGKPEECAVTIDRMLAQVQVLLNLPADILPAMQRGDLESMESALGRFRTMWLQAPEPETISVAERQRIGHGMRNTIGVISGYAMMLLEGMAGDIDPGLAAAVDAVNVSSDLLLESVNTHYHSNFAQG
jgi:hypothetical protein